MLSKLNTYVYTFLGWTTTGSAGALWNTTLLLMLSLYGNQRSTITDCGLLGIGANLSITTFLAGGGNFLPEIVMSFLPIAGGGCGGASRMINGSGVSGLGGCWRITSGGAGGVKVFGSWVMTISPGAGGVGGFRYLTANSCTYSNCCLTFLVIICGLESIKISNNSNLIQIIY